MYWKKQAGGRSLRDPIVIKNLSDSGILKLTVSQKWTDGINWFFACLYKFRNAKSWFNDVWVVKVRNGHDLLVHDTIKSGVS